MLQKIGTYAIVLAVISMILPSMLGYFIGENDSFLFQIPWGYFILSFGSLGVLLFVIKGVREKQQFNFSTLMMLLGIYLILIGFALEKMEIANSRYILLAGLLLIALWITIPTKKTNAED